MSENFVITKNAGMVETLNEDVSAQSNGGGDVSENWFGLTVTLTNDVCVPVRYYITDAPTNKLELAITDTLSLIPGIDKVFNVMTVKGIFSNLLKFTYDQTQIKPFQDIADFLDPEKPKDGWLYPNESVKRKAAADGFINMGNIVKVEIITFNKDQSGVIFWTYQTDELDDKPDPAFKNLKLSDILKEVGGGKRPEPVSAPPKPWNPPKKKEVGLSPAPDCGTRYRLLRIPNLKLKSGGCNVLSYQYSPDGVFCTTNLNPKSPEKGAKPEASEIYPYTFTQTVQDGTELGGFDQKYPMLYYDGPEGRQGITSSISMDGCIPVVKIANCNIKKRAESELVAKTTGKKNRDQVTDWVYEQMKVRLTGSGTKVRGKSYWAVSWDGKSNVYVLEAGLSDDIMGKYILVKKTGYFTFMVCDNWVQLE